MDYYNEIKNELIDNEITKNIKRNSINRNDLDTYYNVGALIVKAQGGEKRAKYGDNLIKEYSKRLMKEINAKYSYRNLISMRKFYLLFKNEKVNALRSQLTWTHYRELLTLDDHNEIIYYIDISIKYNLSYRQLHNKIKYKEYQRLSIETKNKIIEKDEIKVTDFIKNPIIIRNTLNVDEISEKYLKKLILEDLDAFLKELGNTFTYVGNEYKIRIGNSFNYIDLLLFNIEFNCYVVVELKTIELKKEHIGQIEIYMNYVDRNIKKDHYDRTIGIIICKKDNKLVLEYSSDSRIYSTTYTMIIH